MNGNYEVESVRQVVRFTGAGQEIKLYDIHIITKYGATGYIRVPESQYDPETIKQKLNEFADTLNIPFELS